MDKILSISVAAYNVERTIEKCLNSFLSSRYLNLLEILVINDGSHDRTVEIVQKYEEKYPKIIHLINKENGGHGSTINTSLSLANGKYYKVLDGDDWVDSKELDKLVECLLHSHADLIINDYNEVYPNHEHRVSHRNLYQGQKLYSFDEIVPDGNFKNNIFAMHESTVLTQRLRDVGMHIQEHCFYADTEFLYFTGLAARTVEFNNSCAYQYRLGSAGQSVSAEGIYKHIEDLMKIEYHLIQLYNKNEHQIKSSTRRKYLFAIIDTRYFMLFDCFIMIIKKDNKDKMFANFLRQVKVEYPNIVSRCYLPLTYKMVSKFPFSLINIMRMIKQSKAFNIVKSRKK
jgi:glycosyltransferase involved in cell wall biosynthesis